MPRTIRHRASARRWFTVRMNLCFRGLSGRRRSRTDVVRGLIAAVAAGGISVVIFGWFLPRVGAWATGDSGPVPDSVDAIVVLGGDHGRLEEGLRLLQAGVAAELWYTGRGHDVISQVAEARVPRSAIRLLPSNSTWEDGEQVRNAVAATGAKRVLIVTSWYHGRRARRTIEKQARRVDVVFFHRLVAPLGYDGRNWWKVESGRHVLRSEVTKSFYYWFKYGVTLR